MAVQKRIVTLHNKIRLLNKCAKFNKIMYHSKSLSRQYYVTKNFNFFTIMLKSNFTLRKLYSACKIFVNNLNLFLHYFRYTFKYLSSTHFNDINSLYSVYGETGARNAYIIFKKTLKIVNILANTYDRSTPEIFYEPLFFNFYIKKLINPLKLYYIPLDSCFSFFSKLLIKFNKYIKVFSKFKNAWSYVNKLRILNKYYPIYFSYKHSVKLNKNTREINLLVLNNLLKTCTNLITFSKKKI